MSNSKFSTMSRYTLFKCNSDNIASHVPPVILVLSYPVTLRYLMSCATYNLQSATINGSWHRELQENFWRSHDAFRSFKHKNYNCFWNKSPASPSVLFLSLFFWFKKKNYFYMIQIFKKFLNIANSLELQFKIFSEYF